VNQVLTGNCLDLLAQVTDGSVDMVLCDPPYGLTQNPTDIPLDLKVLWEHLRRVGKPHTAYVFTAQMPYSFTLYESNRAWFRYDLCWDKVLVTGFLNAKKMPLRRHEHVLVFYGKPPVYHPQFTEGAPLHGWKSRSRNTGRNYGEAAGRPAPDRAGTTVKYPTSIVVASKAHASVAKHATEKPVELFSWLIRTYSDENALVLDPCVGSGTTAVAAQKTGRRFIVMDSDPACVKLTQDRLKGTTS